MNSTFGMSSPLDATSVATSILTCCDLNLARFAILLRWVSYEWSMLTSKPSSFKNIARKWQFLQVDVKTMNYWLALTLAVLRTCTRQASLIFWGTRANCWVRLCTVFLNYSSACSELPTSTMSKSSTDAGRNLPKTSSFGKRDSKFLAMVAE